jgi:O-acetyl-ADP-ribose deacetylase
MKNRFVKNFCFLSVFLAVARCQQGAPRVPDQPPSNAPKPVPNKKTYTFSTPLASKTLNLSGVDREIIIVDQDIVEIPVDAIVNAANKGLAAGGGVCGAIYKAADSTKLAQAVDAWKKAQGKTGILAGEAMITSACNISHVKYVIHAVGPNNKGGDLSEKNNLPLLKKAYVSSLEQTLASRDIETIAFPLISGAIFAYEPKDSIEQGLEGVKEFFTDNQTSSVKKVYFLCRADNQNICKTALGKFKGGLP